MSLVTEIETCLDAAADCRAAMLVDLDAGLVLAAQGPGMDEAGGGAVLAAAACEILGRARPAALEKAVPDVDHAVVAAESALVVFHRLETDPSRALCLSFDPGAAPEAALAHTRAHLAAVASAGLW